jgi:hypothetical protein
MDTILLSVRMSASRGRVTKRRFFLARMAVASSISAFLGIMAHGEGIRVLDVQTKDPVYDRQRNKIYVVTERGVRSIDLSSGEMGDPLLNRGATAIALSDDHRYLYVGVTRPVPGVARIDLSTKSVDLEFPLPSDPIFGPGDVRDLAVLPGQPGSVAVLDSFDNAVGIFDEGIMRPAHSAAGSVIAFSSTSGTLYGYNGDSSGFALYHITVDETGAHLDWAKSGFVGGYSALIKTAGSRLYSSNNGVVDPDIPRRIGYFPGVSFAAAIAPDLANGRVFMVDGSNEEGPNTRTCTVKAFDAETFRWLGTLRIAQDSCPYTSDLIRWGKEGLAFSDDRHTYLIQTKLVGTERQADLGIELAGIAGPVVVEDTFDYRVTVRNAGPLSATGVAVHIGWNGGITVESMPAACTLSLGIDCRLPDLDAGASTTLILTVRLRSILEVVATATVEAHEADADESNNSFVRTTRVVPAFSRDRFGYMDLGVNDIVSDPLDASRLYASVSGTSQRYSNQVVVIDAARAKVVDSTFAGSEPGRLAVSDDGRYLYVELRGASSVMRMSLPSLAPDLEFPVGEYQFEQLSTQEMVVVPGSPHSVAMSRAYRFSGDGGIAVYDDGVVRPSVARPGSVTLAFCGSSSPLFDLSSGLVRMDVDQSGVHFVDETRGIIHGYYTTISCVEGRLYSSAGDVLDPATYESLGVFEGLTSDRFAHLVDAQAGRALFLGQIQHELRAFDISTFEPVGSVVPVPNRPIEPPGGFARWGQNGFAMGTRDGRVLLARTTLVAAPDQDEDSIPDGEDDCAVFDPEQADDDRDGVGDACDNCGRLSNPDQADFNDNGRGDACDVTLTAPTVKIDCSPGATAPTFTWLPGPYDRFKVFVTRSPDSAATTPASGDKWLTGTSWIPSPNRWQRLCQRAQPFLFIKVLGQDRDQPSDSPDRRRFSEVVMVSR